MKKTRSFLIIFALSIYIAILINPLNAFAQNADDWFIKGFDSTDPKEEIKYYTKTIEIDPTYVQAYLYRGNAHQKLKMYKEAIYDYTKTLEHDTAYGFIDLAYDGLAWCHLYLGEYEKALDDINKALDYKPDFFTLLITRSNIYQAMGRYEEALTDLNKASAEDPGPGYSPIYYRAFYERGLLYKKMGKISKAVSDFKTACDMGGEEACEALKELNK
ncbi:MAG: tetratricopeptide repeat protein [Deltaproteobacteria bacterium]|uniref:Tetratricopeptide repeat protein n=1 Tax=Candidatus Zymogenus saltonus TaxID=2844893 RepID=A0A9D8PP56_9DELT|nr:tetratricopeptide repeat protein [Candidatus Zymogenus saltonus]